MNEHVEQELELIRSFFPDLEYLEWNGQHWIRIPKYPVPAGWSQTEVELACHIPAEAGQPPYGFWVRPPLALESGAEITNCTVAATAWGSDWMQFSWSPVEWKPKADVRLGDNMLNFVRSFADRLRELS